MREYDGFIKILYDAVFLIYFHISLRELDYDVENSRINARLNRLLLTVFIEITSVVIAFDKKLVFAKSVDNWNNFVWTQNCFKN